MTFGLDSDSNSSNLSFPERATNEISMDNVHDRPSKCTPISFNLDGSDTTADTAHSHSPQRPQTPLTHVRICPHHTLSFQQLNKAATSQLTGEHRSLDIFVKLCSGHHYNVETENKPQICSQIYFRNSANLKPGFELSTSWKASCPRLQNGTYSEGHMRRILEKSNVWVCPHVRLSSNWVLKAMSSFLKEKGRGGTSKSSEDTMNHCPRCHTDIQVTCMTERPLEKIEAQFNISTKRSLGKGLREDDDDWLRQCVSLTDGKGQGSEIQSGFQCGVQFFRGIINPSTSPEVESQGRRRNL